MADLSRYARIELSSHNLGISAKDWKATMKDRTDIEITTNSTGHVHTVYCYLSAREYETQMHHPDELWKDPITGLCGEFDNDYFEKQFE